MITPKLFTDSDNWLANAYVGPGAPLANSGAHAHVWKEAADLIADHALAGPRGQLDWFFPVIGYLYRHFVELELKLIARMAADVLREPRPDLTNEHGIEWLRVTAHTLLAKIPAVADALDGPVSPLLRELDKIDPSGQHFRYLTTKEGMIALPSMAVDVEQLKTGMGQIADCFTGVEGWLYDALYFSAGEP